jgi:hypothetical protein
MRRSSASFVATVGTAVTLLAGCGDNPSGPDTFTPPDGTHQSVLAAVTGPGFGGLSVSPVAIASRTFDAVIKIRVEGARANTTYYVQRAPEVGRASGADGICQRALGQSPWSAGDAPAPAFVTFPMPVAAGPLVSFTTQNNGNGSIDFEFASPTIAAGTVFDVMFRLVDNVDAPAAELRSGCFTVTAK